MLSGLLMAVAGATGGNLARPSPPAFSVVPGNVDGKLDFTVSALPTSWGDLTVAGDGAGAAGILQWRNDVDGWQTLRTPAATGAVSKTVSPLLWSTSAAILVRGVSAAGREGVPASATVVVPPAPPVTDESLGSMEIGSSFEVQ